MRAAYGLTLPIPGKVVRLARYLGPRLQYNGALAEEQRLRLHAARAAYAILGGFWRSTRNNRWKGLVFNSMVIGALISGLCSFVLPKSMENALDSQIALLARKVLLGGGLMIARILSTSSRSPMQQHFACFSVTPPSSAVQVQRLRLWQQVVKHPERSVCLLGSMFGEPCWGHSKPNAGTQHKYVGLLCADLCALAALTSLESYIGAVQSNPLVLFTGPDIRDAFLRADPAILLAARCSIAIPPPGYEPLPGQMQCLKNHTSVASLTPRQGWNVVLTSVPTKHWFYIRLNLAGPSMASVSWHMFLRYPISVFFVDLSLRVNGLLPSTLPAHLSVVFVRPGRAAWWYTSTSACLPISARSASWTLMTSSWLKTICSGICLPTLKCGSSTRVAMDTAFHQAFGAPPAPSAAAAREGGPSKVRVVTADKEATAIAEHALKMAVVVEQQLRLTQAAAFRSLPLPVSSEYFKYLQQAYAQYTAQTKGNKGHGLGPPDTFNAAALVDDKAKFDEFLASCKPGSKPAKLAVLLYRCEKMYGNTHKRLLLRLRDHDLEDLLVKHIECTGVEEFHGQRPAGYLANTAQTLLDSRK